MAEDDVTRIRALARRRWNERESAFPPFTRQTWEQGTFLARCTALRDAAVELGLMA